MSDAAGLTCDAFLDGQLTITQPKTGFRASTDAVLLAASVPAQSGETVLDIGCGVGTASLCLLNRVDAQVTGLELQGEYADLALQNSKENGHSLEVISEDLFAPTKAFKERSFDHIMTNPPFFSNQSIVPPADSGKATAHMHSESLSDWITFGLKRLKQGGYLTAIIRSDDLAELLGSLSQSSGAIRILPIAARASNPAKRVIVQARKAINGPTELLAPLVMHQGESHDGDKDNYSEIARSILRSGSAIESLMPKNGRD